MAAQVVTPGYVRTVKGEGMPKSKQPGQKGDLRIVFEVQVKLEHILLGFPACHVLPHVAMAHTPLKILGQF